MVFAKPEQTRVLVQRLEIVSKWEFRFEIKINFLAIAARFDTGNYHCYQVVDFLMNRCEITVVACEQ